MKKHKLSLVSMIVFLTVFSLTAIFDIQNHYDTKATSTDTNDTLTANAEPAANVTEEPVIQSFSYDTDITSDTDAPSITPAPEVTASPTPMPTLTPTPEPSATPTPEPIYANIGISIAKDYVNIREKASTDSAVLGKLYKDSACEILGTEGDWYYVESGSVKGYVSREYIITGLSDDELIKNYGTLSIQVKCDGLNVRESRSLDSKKLTVIYMNEIYPVVKDEGEWININIPDDNVTGYVKSEYAELLVEFKEAVSKEEEELLQQLAAEEKAKKETVIKKQESVDYEYDELELLACLIHSEAGTQSYETKLAVANIVLNRMKSSKYPSSMKSVIYQSGQFTVAASGSLKKQLNNYDNYSSSSQKLSIKAAKDALAGSNNIGSRMHFNSYQTAVRKGYDDKSTAVKLGGLLFW